MLSRFFLSFSFIFFSACFFDPSINAGPSAAFLASESGTSPSNSTFMYVDLDVSAYETSSDQETPIYEISTTKSYGGSLSRNSPSNCEIEYIPSESEEGTVSTPVLICILDMMEGEFILKDINLVYNFPGGMCKQIYTALPWHFNHPLLPGPIVEECKLTEGADTEVSGFRCTNFSACSSCTKEEENVCPGSGVRGVKCCYGGEKTDGSYWQPDKECFGGPGVVADGVADFRPEHRSILPETGLRGTIKLKNLIAVNNAYSINGVSVSVSYANYLPLLDLSDPLELRNLNFSSRPDFLQPSPSGYPYLPRLFFEFVCLDDAAEEIHQILLMIREWNTFEEFIAFYDVGGKDDQDPNVEGEEGINCSYDGGFTTVGSGHCNDLLDLEDVIDCNKSLYPLWCSEFESSNGKYPRILYSPPKEEGAEGG